MHPMRSACARQRHALKRGLRSIDAHAFVDPLTDPSMLDEVEAHRPPHRERLPPPTETLAMFLAQAFSADRSPRPFCLPFDIRLLSTIRQYDA